MGGTGRAGVVAGVVVDSERVGVAPRGVVSESDGTEGVGVVRGVVVGSESGTGRVGILAGVQRVWHRKSGVVWYGEGWSTAG